MDLMDLYDHTTPIVLEKGGHLYSCAGGPIADHNRGLFFIASGTMKIERDSSMSMTRGAAQTGGGSSLMFNPNRSLGSMQARTGTIGKESALLKAGARQRNVESFIRLARVGPGWVVGLLEGVGASQYPSHQVAVTKCKLHHLPYHKIEELQEQDPHMILRLYKLLSHLMARRQEITIGQLVTLHSIMTSPAAGKPIGRSRSGTGRGSSFQ
jgi:CRP-like cAMP-binding protein